MNHPFLRGHGLARNADGILQIGEERFFVEMDMGTESHSQVKQRFESYEDDLVMVVCESERRLQNLRSLELDALYGVLKKIIADPYGSVWTDAWGVTRRVKNPVAEPVG
jgi:hypothetical protein